MVRKALFICGVAEKYKFTYLVARDIEECKNVKMGTSLNSKIS